MDAQTVTAIASAGVAAISAVVSVYYSHRSTQYALRSAQNQYEDHMRVWAERTVDVTAQLVELLSNEDGEQEFNATRGQLVASLRCQIDKGRWVLSRPPRGPKGRVETTGFPRYPAADTQRPGGSLRRGQEGGLEGTKVSARESRSVAP